MRYWSWFSRIVVCYVVDDPCYDFCSERSWSKDLRWRMGCGAGGLRQDQQLHELRSSVRLCYGHEDEMSSSSVSGLFSLRYQM